MTARLAIALLLLPLAAQAAPTVEIFTWDSFIESPCNGETIHYYGEVEMRRNDRSDEGEQKVTVSINYRWLEAVGLESGTVYDVTGHFHENFGNDGTRAKETYINRLHFTAPGPGDDVHYDELLHVTVNANGELTVEHDAFSAECR